MDRWCREMGFNPDNIDDFIQEFEKCCPPTLKLCWKQVLSSVKPRKDVQIIRKQCLLNKLRTSKQSSKIEFCPNSSEEYSKYLKKREERHNLKKLLDTIEQKKAFIAERINNLVQSDLRMEQEEEIMKQNIYKLIQLKKKNITVTRQIDKLSYETELLQLITNEPNKIVDFGPDKTAWDIQLLKTVKELPEGAEEQAVISKMTELAKMSHLPPVPYFDRTKWLVYIENMLISMIEKLNSCTMTLELEEDKLEQCKEKFINLILQESDGTFTEDDTKKVLESAEDEYCKDVGTVSEELKSAEPPYSLALEHHNIKRLQWKIEDKVKDIKRFLPSEDDKIQYDSEFEGNYCVGHLPLNLPVDRLYHFVLDEVTLFSKLHLYEPVQAEVMHSHIHLGSSSASQLIKLKKDIERHSKLSSLEEKIYSLEVPSLDSASKVSCNEKTIELHQKLKESIRTINDLSGKVTKNYENLKEAFIFLRNDPLNEALTGLEVEGEDVKHWLKRFKRAKDRFNHEQWLQQQISKKICSSQSPTI